MENVKYRNIPLISPGFIFVQKAFLLGLFSGELIFGGAYNNLRLRIGGLIFGRAFFYFLFWGGGGGLSEFYGI